MDSSFQLLLPLLLIVVFMTIRCAVRYLVKRTKGLGMTPQFGVCAEYSKTVGRQYLKFESLLQSFRSFSVLREVSRFGLNGQMSSEKR